MNPYISKVKSVAEQWIAGRISRKTIMAEYYNRTDNRANYKRQATTYQAKEIKDWNMAVMAATDPDNPRRGELMRFYKSLRLDNHLSSILDTRILRVQRSSFKFVNEKGDENEDLKKLFERPWFEELIKLVIGKTFQGTTLIELFDIDENGELLCVNEIPQSNFIAQQGIIIKEEWDNSGVSYRDGIYKDYYLQIGNDWDLGMFNELSMIVLAKKLGLGSWMSYIDKFGVPPIFAITDRMDTQRRDELFEMLENFKSNHFAVLQGNEKIDLPTNYTVDAYQSFKTLAELCNSEMSKRVLGGTATVDEKSFVGSAQVQERVAQDRYEADKLLFKYYFNAFVRQRLAKLSSVYSDLLTHTLIWDNQETLDITGYIDGVEKLSQYYDFDVEEVKKRTGLPIIGKKAIATTEPPQDPQKKKSEPTPKAVTKPFIWNKFPATLYAATWDAATERLANDLYNGKVSPSDLDRDLVLKNYDSLAKGAATGWGDDFYTNDTARQMRENLMDFAGAKAYNLMTNIEALKNTTKSKDEFISEAKKVVNLHNETYLEVEKQMASAKSSAARDYQHYVKNKDIYPNLKLRTMEDDDVRQTHKLLDGLVKPVDEWTEIPPFDPRCRCRLEQTNDAVNNQNSSFPFNPQYANNPALTGEAFPKQHSYFEKVPSDINGTVKNNVENIKLLAPYIQDPEYKKLNVNHFADINEVDDNINTAHILLQNIKNIDIAIRPHTAANGISNPEYLINGKIADAKRIKSINGIKSGISDANEQNCKYVVFDFNKNYDKQIPLDLVQLQKVLAKKARMKEARKMKGYYIVIDDKAVFIDAKTAKKGDFINDLKILKP